MTQGGEEGKFGMILFDKENRTSGGKRKKKRQQHRLLRGHGDQNGGPKKRARGPKRKNPKAWVAIQKSGGPGGGR